MTIQQVIQNGPNKWTRLIGHATVEGHPVRLQVRSRDWGQAVVEYRSAIWESDTWHQIGSNWPLTMQFGKMLDLLPDLAQVQLTQSIIETVSHGMILERGASTILLSALIAAAGVGAMIGLALAGVLG